jgi:hypothetical protein
MSMSRSILRKVSFACGVLALSLLLGPAATSAQDRQGSNRSGSHAGSPRAQAPSGRTQAPSGRNAVPRTRATERRAPEARQGHGGSTRTGKAGNEGRRERITPPQTAGTARERGDRPADGVAVPRDRVRRDGRDDWPVYRYPHYGYRYPYYGYGYPYGYSPYSGFYGDPFLYDPFFWGFPGVGFAYPMAGYSTYAYGSSGSYGGSERSIDDGGIRLKVKPREADVLVDGYYVGRVDDFDGMFQRLEIRAGTHRIEIRADGYETLGFDVRIPIDETITYHGELVKTVR